MFRDHTVGVVVPAHNEAGLVGEVMATLPAFADRAYVIDDRSTDGTWAEISRTAARLNASRPRPAIADGGTVLPRFVAIRHDRNRGRGAAVKTGYLAALADGMDVVAVLDGDGQMDPDLLDRFVAPVVAGEVDYAKGNRLSRLEHRDGMSRWRFVGNVLLTTLTHIASGYWRTGDSQNGYTAISASTLRRLDVDGLYDGYGFLNDILVKLHVAGARVGDVVMPARYGDEQSGIRYRTFIPRVSGLLLRDFVWRVWTEYRRRDADLYPQLYGLGAVDGLAGLVVLGYALLGVVSVGVAVPMALALWLLGGLAAVQAIAYERANEAHLERRYEAWFADRPEEELGSGAETLDHPLL